MVNVYVVGATNTEAPGYGLVTEKFENSEARVILVNTHLPQFHVPDFSVLDTLETPPKRAVHVR